MPSARSLIFRTQVSPEAAAHLRWRPTPSLLQAMVAAAAASLLAMLTRRLDLLVLASPFIVAAAWGLISKPTQIPRIAVELNPTQLQEGQSTRWRLFVDDVAGCDHLVTVLAPTPHTVTDPAAGASLTAVTGETVTIEATVQIQRWGRPEIGRAALTAVGPLNAYRCGPLATPGQRVMVTPTTETFALRALAPHPDGVVGLNRSRRRGDGSEFADIRAFQPGDRLRHIHWPVSARTGELHVRTSYAEEDAEVHLVVDAALDVGVSDGLHGAASSLDRAVRASAALSHALLQRGERVGLVIRGRTLHHLPPRGGQLQQRRILDTLTDAVPRTVDGGRRIFADPRMRLSPGSLVILLTPMIHRESIDQAQRFAARGHTVVVVDCLPPDVRIAGAEEDPMIALTWRARRLERELDIERLNRAGVPVVPWRGPGSLDSVLRQLAGRPRPVVQRR